MRSLPCSYDFTIIKGYKRDRVASWLVTIYPKHASHGLTDNVLWFMGCLPKINTSVGRMCLSKLPNSTLRFPTKRWQWQQQWRYFQTGTGEGEITTQPIGCLTKCSWKIKTFSPQTPPTCCLYTKVIRQPHQKKTPHRFDRTELSYQSCRRRQSVCRQWRRYLGRLRWISPCQMRHLQSQLTSGPMASHNPLQFNLKTKNQHT